MILDVVGFRTNMECAPTVRGEIKKARASNYDLYSALNEFVDNSLDAGAQTILIDIREHIEEKNRWIHKILVSDDAPSGIARDNLKRIFSWTYERPRSEDEIGEFGTGFKSASVNLGNKLTILTHDAVHGCTIQAMADWHEMSEENTYVPKILNLDTEFFKSYHPFHTGTTLMIENIRHEFIQQQKGNDHFLIKVFQELSMAYKYYLKHHPRIGFIVRGCFTTSKNEAREISYSQKNHHMHYYFDRAYTIESEVIVLKDTNAYRIFLHRKDIPYWETIEFVEKRKNGNNILRSIHIPPVSSMTHVDTIIFRSGTYYPSDLPESYGTVDIIRNHRILARDITYRMPRQDPHIAFLKHEVVYNNKWLNALLGIQFNKSNDGNIPEGDMRYTLEFIQKLHEKELIRYEKQKLDRVVMRDKEEDEYLCLDTPLPPENPVETKSTIPPVATSIPRSIISLTKDEDVPQIPAPAPLSLPTTITTETRRKNFSLETKLETLKQQECRDQYFDFRLLDDILPLDYDHKDGPQNNARDNCQVLSVISHALKSRRPKILEHHCNDKYGYIVDLLNCITSSRFFIEGYLQKKITICPSTDLTRRTGLFIYQKK